MTAQGRDEFDVTFILGSGSTWNPQSSCSAGYIEVLHS